MAVYKTDYQTGYTGITNTDVASFLKRTLTTSEQSLVDSLIAEVERSLCRECNRQFSEITEYYEVFESGISQFDLYNLPISAITKIEVDNVDVTSNYTLASDYWIIDGLYVKFETPIISTDIYTGVKITYQIRKFWGDDIKLLVKKWAAYEFLNSENGGVGASSVNFSELSQTFNISQYQKEKEKVINYYKLLRP
ncbi:MAG: hypothetical protein D6822_08420 [Cyanobacteria bacterium J149]|nr:MAG: hypothetical protein D6822_08420 [Cyanobacteria bacterium J149]